MAMSTAEHFDITNRDHFEMPDFEFKRSRCCAVGCERIYGYTGNNPSYCPCHASKKNRPMTGVPLKVVKGNGQSEL